jgi:hypothetical protein
MRAGRINPDGNLEISTAIAKFSKDRDRYERFRAGVAIGDICVEDQIDPEKAIASIRQGRMLVEAEQLLELRDLNHSNAVAVARMRAKARIEHETLVLDGLEKLLKGKRTITSIDKESGQILTEIIDDPEVISMGLEHARKIMSIDERPAANSTYVNIQTNQQNNYGEGPSSKAETYEERLKRIRNSQIANNQPEPVVIEAEIVKVESTEPSADPPEQKDWENF